MLRQVAARYRPLMGVGLAAALIAPGVALADKKKDDEPRGPVFDPEALERGAKALREINASPHSKQVIELSKQQEVTKQAEAREREADYKRQAAMFAKEQEQARWEQQKQFAQEEAQRQAQLAQYQDELSRKRLATENELQRQRNAEMVQLQEESSARREQERLRVEQQVQAERRAAEQYKADLQKQIEKDKALAEAQGRILEARENEDVNRRAALLRYQEETRKAIETINAVASHMGDAAMSLLTDRTKLLVALGGATGLFLGLYGAREATRVVGKLAETYFGTPKLVRETSVKGLLNPRRYFSGGPGSKSADEVRRDFKDIILQRELHDSVRALAAAAANTKRHGAPFRHMLFYGPPGTGKTLAAKRLARTSGLDFAIMSGGDVAPLAGGAVTQLHGLFDWAQTSRKGLLLFIDEADAFLGRRSDNMSEGLRGALNALLFRTGDQSRDFMVVLATNRPGDLDDAVLDRMDEALEFGLPDTTERKAMLDLYLDRYIVKAGTEEGGAGAGALSAGEKLKALLKGGKGSADRIANADVDDATLWDTARKMEGFSGREIAKFMASVQAAVYGSHEAVLTKNIFHAVLAHKLYEHDQRRQFRLGHHGTGDSPAPQRPAIAAATATTQKA